MFELLFCWRENMASLENERPGKYNVFSSCIYCIFFPPRCQLPVWPLRELRLWTGFAGHREGKRWPWATQRAEFGSTTQERYIKHPLKCSAGAQNSPAEVFLCCCEQNVHPENVTVLVKYINIYSAFFVFAEGSHVRFTLTPMIHSWEALTSFIFNQVLITT